MSNLLISRYNHDIVAASFVTYVHFVMSDIQKGYDVLKNKKICSSPVFVFNKEIIKYAICTRGKEFGKEVEEYLEGVDDNPLPFIMSNNKK